MKAARVALWQRQILSRLVGRTRASIEGTWGFRIPWVRPQRENQTSAGPSRPAVLSRRSFISARAPTELYSDHGPNSARGQF